ncbi:MAG TPA: helix-turn-helix domain-containing protein [Roseiflexaceae bacterium]|nr:helix-turn-helix domain-containing protein [Roseiflexaceae bacterium]
MTVRELQVLQVTIREAAELLSYDPRHIRRLVQKGELVAVGQGRGRRIKYESLIKFQERNTVGGGRGPA